MSVILEISYQKKSKTLKYENLIIEKKEYLLLKRLVNLSRYYKEKTLRKSFEKLFDELDAAHIYDEEAIPKDVVRLNSLVTIDSKTDGLKKFQLVLPTESDIKQDKISILTALGAALIGHAESDTIYLDLPSGKEVLTIANVVQNRKSINLTMVL